MAGDTEAHGEHAAPRNVGGLSPVAALDAIRNAARVAVDCPESERVAALSRLSEALDAYDALVSAWAKAMSEGQGQRYRADEPPPDRGHIGGGAR